MVQYRRTVYSVLWVQFALVALYVAIIIAHHQSYLASTMGMAMTLLYFNSTLNPPRNYWRISEL
ncbi:unnamed protein product [Pocillopora meandrina]|uniref:Uncharacterized protein n=1 Tax=Pocillopora meandrina TaxID=46732 RepID=A0AAU9WJ41_9CNID|nr:unnamed protein product [Pocillopora meandrina]